MTAERPIPGRRMLVEYLWLETDHDETVIVQQFGPGVMYLGVIDSNQPDGPILSALMEKQDVSDLRDALNRWLNDQEERDVS